jgi:hypothetical protein
MDSGGAGGSGAGAAGVLHDDPKPTDDVDPSAGMG